MALEVKMKIKSAMYFIAFTLFLLECVSIAFAKNKHILRFDKLMTPEEQKRMGITKLTKSERELLEQWLTNWTLNVLVKATVRSGQTYDGVGGSHWVSKKIDGGRFIKLEDGSLWEISPIDRINTRLWLVTEEITVIESGNPLYPYMLINSDSEDTAEAKLISR
ncbi:MAG: hypothetical protein H0Z29_10590 [Candidatus Marinimicrobia bacterium]|nr:hypothetical protein [Candidatus Neomarinimicrobiota bacterium]